MQERVVIILKKKSNREEAKTLGKAKSTIFYILRTKESIHPNPEEIGG